MPIDNRDVIIVLTHLPYELPEIISVPAEGGLPAYLDWVAVQSVIE